MYYSVNKAYLNLGFPGKYPDTSDTINPVLEQGVIKSAVFEDFFYYTNDHSLNKFKEISNFLIISIRQVNNIRL